MLADVTAQRDVERVDGRDHPVETVDVAEIAILLGSSSLDDAVARLNELEQSARQSEDAVTDTQRGRAQLSELATILAAQVPATQPPPTAGIVKKGKVPVSIDVLKTKLPKRSKILAVTGGTGRYSEAAGNVLVQEISEEETNLTFHLAP